MFNKKREHVNWFEWCVYVCFYASVTGRRVAHRSGAEEGGEAVGPPGRAAEPESGDR